MREEVDLKSGENQIMNINRRLLMLFAVIASFGTYVIILLGVLVTFTGSGHGCGQTWPFCHGEIIPGSLTISGMIEYSHRLQAGADSFLVFTLAIWSWLTYRKDFRVKLFALLSILFILAQGALGAVTVVYEGTWELNWFLAAHFGLSLIAFASVLLLTVRIFQVDKANPGHLRKPLGAVTGLQWPILALAVYTYIVIYTGALVEHTGAVTACGQQLPSCATYVPSFSSLAGIQVLHRYAAGLLWSLVLWLLVAVVRGYRERRDIRLGAIWAFLLITLQAVSGAFNVWSEGQMLFALIHATLIALFFSILCYLCTEVGWPGRKKLAQGEWKPFDSQGVSTSILSDNKASSTHV
jgi:heme a synthase